MPIRSLNEVAGVAPVKTHTLEPPISGLLIGTEHDNPYIFGTNNEDILYLHGDETYNFYIVITDNLELHKDYYIINVSAPIDFNFIKIDEATLYCDTSINLMNSWNGANGFAMLDSYGKECKFRLTEDNLGNSTRKLIISGDWMNDVSAQNLSLLGGKDDFEGFSEAYALSNKEYHDSVNNRTNAIVRTAVVFSDIVYNYDNNWNVSTILVDATAVDYTINLPTIGTINYPDSVGKILTIKKIDSSAYTVTIIPDLGIPNSIDGAAEFILDTQYQSITIQAVDEQWYIIGSTTP